MSEYVLAQSLEYVEYAVRDLARASEIYDRMGFTAIGLRTDTKRKSKLYMQGDIRIILTASSSEADPAFHFVRAHGDGVIDMAYRVANVEESHRLACKKGARPAHGPEQVRSENGHVQTRSAIHLFGDVRTTFLSYDQGGRLEDFFREDFHPLDSKKGRFLQTIDHITVNVEQGQLDRWADFYKDVFGFQQVRYFDIRTERTGLLSRAMRSPNGRITMPFNEPTNAKSQIQEFIDVLHGPGVQHMAFHTSNIVLSLDEFQKQGFKFLTVPETYYEAVPKRVPHVAEDLKTLANYGILVDGDEKGYLLQIFTENVVGPFFFELIQRKGNDGFGEGNFRALFEAIERDQIRRGVL